MDINGAKSQVHTMTTAIRKQDYKDPKRRSLAEETCLNELLDYVGYETLTGVEKEWQVIRPLRKYRVCTMRWCGYSRRSVDI